jgi:hypothetical protein
MKHKHHIIPKHAGGTDDPSNIIELTIEEHAEAHRLLFEEFGRHQDWLAWQGLAGLITKEEIVKEHLSTAGKKGGSAGKGVTGNRAKGGYANWEKNYEKLSIILKENGIKYGHLGGVKSKDSLWINNGIETRKIKNGEIPDGWVLGRLPMGDDQKEKISKSSKGIKKPIRTQEHKDKISKNKKGQKWFHDPVSNKSGQFKIENIPEGWIAGRVTKVLKI